jgi:hypothetical protein
MFLAQSFNDIESVLLRHLDVEEYELGVLTIDRVDRLGAILAFADQSDAFLVTQKALDAVTCERLIVNY